MDGTSNVSLLDNVIGGYDCVRRIVAMAFISMPCTGRGSSVIGYATPVMASISIPPAATASRGNQLEDLRYGIHYMFSNDKSG